MALTIKTWRSYLRFSIRELFLVTTTIASLLALSLTFLRPRGELELSPFFDGFDVENLIRQVGRDVGCDSNFMLNADDDWSYCTEWNFCNDSSCLLKLPKSRVDAFSEQLQTVLEANAQAAGCEIEGASSNRGGGSPTQAFSIDYRKGRNVGCVHIWVCEVGPELVHVVAYIREGQDKT